jgi:hypothetical protein
MSHGLAEAKSDSKGDENSCSMDPLGKPVHIITQIQVLRATLEPHQVE